MGERRPDGGRPHLRLAAHAGALLGLLRSALRDARGQAPERRPPGAGRARGGRPARRGDHPEHRRPARRRRLARRDRGARLDLHGFVPGVRGAGVAGGDAPAAGGGGRRGAAVRLRAAAEARRGAVRRAARRSRDGARVGAGGGRRPAAVRRLLARGLSGRRAARADARGRGRVAIVTQGATPYDGVAAARLSGDVEADLEALVAAVELRH